ncbi:MAG: PilZ domain-containing protein [Thermodesulfovibrionales bacterium]
MTSNEMSNSGKKTEQRGSPRGIINASIKVKCRNNSFFSTANNISISGVLLEADTVLAPGDEITCWFVLQYKIMVAGEVVRVVRKSSDLSAFGVRFIDLDTEATAQIEEMIGSQRIH